ncbi:hypothetical protein NE237_023610 [Protea cynaroides]|uniref:F-box protein n=1 Tax=Protea cynaroides TaxID=273540 RepID=A0A9Q0HEB5_9MAGN|nr:hypothetical protein NE237_023610 [Protea cynaroides]
MKESYPRWEDLHVDCLVMVFQKIGVESLILGIPFVCKSWYRASLNPLCWRYLCLPAHFNPFMARFMDEYRVKKHKSGIGFVKLLVHRSQGSIAWIEIPHWCSELQGLESISDELDQHRKMKARVSEI